MVDTDLHIVDRCTLAPGMCIASFSDDDPKGFIDTLLTPSTVDPRVYISVSWVLSTAKKLQSFETEPAEVERLKRENRDLKAQLSEADRRLEAVDLLESSGFTARKKRGPRKKED